MPGNNRGLLGSLQRFRHTEAFREVILQYGLVSPDRTAAAGGLRHTNSSELRAEVQSLAIIREKQLNHGMLSWRKCLYSEVESM